MRFLLLYLLFFATSPIHATNFSVTHSGDSGAGSLRQALIDANASGALPHFITFTPAYPQFGNIVLQSSLPIITALDVRVRGGDRGPVIDGVGTYAMFRAALNVSLDLDGLNMQYGLNVSGGCITTETAGGTGSLIVTRGYFFQCKAVATSFPNGGAINWKAISPALLAVNDSGFFQNQAISSNIATEQPFGGAISSTANTIIRRSTFKDNSTVSAGDRGGFGGAISLFLQDASGVSEIVDSRFDSNTTDTATTSWAWGGAVHAYLVPGGLILIERNFFTGNQAREGGAVSLNTQMLSTTTQATMINNTFVENTAQLDGGAINFKDMEVFANHNTFYQNSAAAGSHLSIERVKMRTLVHNVLAPTAINSACSITNSSVVSEDMAGNLFDEVCGILSSTGGSLSNNLNVQEIDVSQPVGVVVFSAGADPIDGGTVNPSDCRATDARGTPRPLDGDNDGTAVCDVGAYEAPSDILFKDGFET